MQIRGLRMGCGATSLRREGDDFELIIQTLQMEREMEHVN